MASPWCPHGVSMERPWWTQSTIVGPWCVDGVSRGGPKPDAVSMAPPSCLLGGCDASSCGDGVPMASPWLTPCPLCQHGVSSVSPWRPYDTSMVCARHDFVACPMVWPCAIYKLLGQLGPEPTPVALAMYVFNVPTMLCIMYLPLCTREYIVYCYYIAVL